MQEWIEAARWAGYKIHEFFMLDAKWMNLIVASYRTSMQVEAVLANEEMRRMRAESAKSKSKGRRSF